jgi:hypothetical protein
VARGAISGFSYGAPGPQLTVVGQLLANLYPGTVSSCVDVWNNADLYMRDFTCTTNYNAPAVEAHGATLHLLRAVLFNSGGGLIVDASNFEIVDTIISDNNDGEFPVGTSSYGGIYVNNPPASGLKRLERVTLEDYNNPNDIVCTSGIVGVGVYAPNNKGISTACGITPCTLPSATCGSDLVWTNPSP